MNETPEAGVKREVLEETGLDVDVVRLSGVYKNMNLGILALVFRCELEGGSPKITEETSSVAWHSVAEIRKRIVPAYAVRIADALRSADHIPVRIHDSHDLVATS